jgi:hypothetical protein
VTLVFLPISRELVAVIEPAPAFVIPQMPHHSSVEADPTVIVATLEKLLVTIPPGDADVPVIVRAPVTVRFPDASVTPLPIVKEATVGVDVTRKLPGELLLLIVIAPTDTEAPPCHVRATPFPLKTIDALLNVAVTFVPFIRRTLPVVPVIVHVPLPMLMVRVPEPEKSTVPAVTLLLLVLKSSVPVKLEQVSVVRLNEA